jgi:ribosomal protein S18 acetylase RimI-like enzyme
MIREYDPARDADAVTACIAELQEFERALEPVLPRGSEIADAYLQTLIERCKKSAGRILVAEVDQCVVGFVCVLARVEPESPDEERASYAYVSDLALLPGHRGRGLGRQLLEEAEILARRAGVESLQIGVLSRNDGAARLYRSFGFVDFRIHLTKRLA